MVRKHYARHRWARTSKDLSADPSRASSGGARRCAKVTRRPRHCTRRDALSALPLAGAGIQARGAARIQIGIATTDFREHGNSDLARELAGQGIRTIQLFFTQTDRRYWKYEGRSGLPGLTPERAREIAAAYRSQGISIHSIGVYTTLVHADPAERKANLAYFDAMMKVGAYMGVRTFVTEAGH